MERCDPKRLQRVRQVASKLPKVQLHLHLDGSISESFIEQRAAARAVQLPCEAAQLRNFLVASKMHDVANGAFVQRANSNWSQFDFCNQFLQTTDELTVATRQLVVALVDRNVWVAEIRFCPLLHMEEGLSADDAVAAVVNGFGQARADAASRLPHGLKGGVILCALRSHDDDKVREVCQLAEKWLHRGVIGLDVAGDERSYPLRLLEKQLHAARCSGVPLTIHAGECTFNGADENIRLALEIGAERIGHGLALDNSSDDLCQAMRSAFLETCVTANCSGGYKIEADRFDLHPIGRLLKRGVKVAAFNCDNMLLSGTVNNRAHVDEEIVRARVHCKLGWQQIAQVLINGAHASFDDSIRSNKEHNEFLLNFEQAVHLIIGSLHDVDNEAATL
ncbi:unnamed protein product [Agarophyton chilense]|eukprot:gb/GEZJ01001803.1/.p3 GENE.gb/GEZJ01001803.1/~~gb/GEZJ01001803.1/.p3  ORF type:complete len:392 (+),score=71.88 gb/GEZJ01001803.1/:3025-4200(+)